MVECDIHVLPLAVVAATAVPIVGRLSRSGKESILPSKWSEIYAKCLRSVRGLKVELGKSWRHGSAFLPAWRWCCEPAGAALAFLWMVRRGRAVLGRSCGDKCGFVSGHCFSIPRSGYEIMSTFLCRREAVG